jgi:enoyl-CoA hydratase/carnithine racemase
MTSAERPLLVEQRGTTRWLILNRPARRNALDGDVIVALADALAAACEDDHTRVIVLAGNGPSFCAGADLKHLLHLADEPERVFAFLAEVSAFAAALERCAKPTIAAVHGHVVAGGLELSLACDVVVAAERTLIGDGHLNNGLLPAAGSSVRLASRLGHATARRLLLSGVLVDAAELATTGWIQAVVPRRDLELEAERLATSLAAPNKAAQQNLKVLLGRLVDTSETDGLALELDAFADNWFAADVPAQLRAFAGLVAVPSVREAS